MSACKNWDVEAAKSHYRIANWGLGFFGINRAGHVYTKIAENEIDLFKLSKQLKKAGIGLPVVVRFPHILQQLLSNLYTAFGQAIGACGYTGKYVAAYPIKVNQQASVIEHYHRQGQWPVAFEVGSKAELIACLGILKKPRQTIICNGYKDEAYIRLALLGILLGHEVVIVLESLLEFQHVLKLSTTLEVTPVLGVRIRLSLIAKGNWQNTGGKHSKFGLTANEVMQLLDELKKHDAMAWMQMLHFHMGSQIPCLKDIRSGTQEGMQYFAELSDLGIKFNKLNVGGGLAVDYEGAHSNSYFSMDYSINDYAHTIIARIHSVCQDKGLEAPTVFTESGRVMTAYHAVLFTNVIDAEYPQENIFDANVDLADCKLSSNANLKQLLALHQLVAATQGTDPAVDTNKSYLRLQRILHDLDVDFSNRTLSLADKAHVEKLCNAICTQLVKHKENLQNEHYHELEEKFIDKYFCNFSLFQSTPDIWGLQQIFPVLPLHRLHERPSRKVRLHDLTCDSDGQINRYINAGSIQSYLSLHEFRLTQEYVLGLFLVGAYQEILGDLHNLFGGTNTVNVALDSNGDYQICGQEPSDSIEDILSYIHIDSKSMRQVWLKKLTQMKVSAKTRNFVLQELEASLQTDNYLN